MKKYETFINENKVKEVELLNILDSITKLKTNIIDELFKPDIKLVYNVSNLHSYIRDKKYTKEELAKIVNLLLKLKDFKLMQTIIDFAEEYKLLEFVKMFKNKIYMGHLFLIIPHTKYDLFIKILDIVGYKKLENMSDVMAQQLCSTNDFKLDDNFKYLELFIKYTKIPEERYFEIIRDETNTGIYKYVVFTNNDTYYWREDLQKLGKIYGVYLADIKDGTSENVDYTTFQLYNTIELEKEFDEYTKEEQKEISEIEIETDSNGIYNLNIEKEFIPLSEYGCSLIELIEILKSKNVKAEEEIKDHIIEYENGNHRF